MNAVAEETWIDPNDAYHLDFSRDSNSSLRLFAESIPLYAAIRVYQTMPPPEPTPDLVLGNVVHCLVLEPWEFDKRYIVPNRKYDRRTKEGKAAWEAFEHEIARRTVIDPDMFAIACRIKHALLDNPTTRAILEADGDVERVITWDDPETGCPLKLKADKILANGLMADLKTTGSEISPDAWGRTMNNFRYHCQADLYLTGAWIAARIEGPLVHVVASKTEPFEVACFTPDEETLAVGRRINRATIRELVECRATGNWAGRWSDGIKVARLPGWAFRE